VNALDDEAEAVHFGLGHGGQRPAATLAGDNHHPALAVLVLGEPMIAAILLDATRPRYRQAAAATAFGSISRRVLDHLRRAGKPQSAEDLAGEIIEERSLNTGGPRLRRAMNKRVGMALSCQRTNRIVREVPVEGGRRLRG
jgi:hypothetical protein